MKLIFDKAVYNVSWKNIISSEIFRQRDKANTNEIGYFHQRIFRYIANCRVPNNGQEGGWDIIFQPSNGYTIGDSIFHTVYVEMKNKHNTMNSSAAGKTYIKMQNKILHDNDCVCFLVEVIAACSQNKAWSTTVDGQKVSHERIRRVSIDHFYEIVTGEENAFMKICIALPSIINSVLSDMNNSIQRPRDKAYSELKRISRRFTDRDNDTAMILALYMLGFSSYSGFKEFLNLS